MAQAVGGILQGAAGIGSMFQGSREADNAAANTESAMNFVAQNVDIAGELDSLMAYYGDQGIEYAQGMMDSWEASFGGIEQNLSEYYNSLDPVKFSQEQKTAYAQQLDKNLTQYREGLTQRGLMTSGMRNQLEKEAMFSKATSNASFDINAPEQVAQMKMGWLNYGANQKTNAQQSLLDANKSAANMAQIGSNAMMNANSSIANVLSGQAAQNAESSAGYMQAGGTLLGQGFSNLNDYYSKQSNNSSSSSSSDTTTSDTGFSFADMWGDQ